MRPGRGAGGGDRRARDARPGLGFVSGVCARGRVGVQLGVQVQVRGVGVQLRSGQKCAARGCLSRTRHSDRATPRTLLSAPAGPGACGRGAGAPLRLSVCTFWYGFARFCMCLHGCPPHPAGSCWDPHQTPPRCTGASPTPRGKIASSSPHPPAASDRERRGKCPPRNQKLFEYPPPLVLLESSLETRTVTLSSDPSDTSGSHREAKSHPSFPQWIEPAVREF